MTFLRIPFVFIGFFLVCSVLTAQEKPVEIVFLGDSLTEGYGVFEEQSFPMLIEQQLKKNGFSVNVVNAGISGSTSAGAESRLRWLLKNKPDILILALGANDGLRGLSTDNMQKNLSDVIQLAQDNQVRVILAGMLIPPNYGEEYENAFKNVFPALAQKYSIPLIPFLLEGVAGLKEYNLPDGIHPNPEGHKIVAETVYPYIEKALTK